MRCRVDGCTVSMAGQMVVCSPHWPYLGERLRNEIIDVHNELARQQMNGNPRRDAWRALLPRVDAELVRARIALEKALGARVAADGVAWRRASRKIEAAAVVLPTVADVTPDEAAGELLAVDGEILPPGTVGRRP